MKAANPAPMDRSAALTPALACWALVCWALAGLVALAVTQGWTARFDHAGLLAWRDAARAPIGLPALTGVFVGLSDLGNWLGRRALAGLAAVFLWQRGERRAVLALLFTTLSDGLVNDALKLAFARPRPMVVPHLVEASGFSFPSGHAFGAAATFVAVALALRAAGAGAKSIQAGAIALSLAIAFSRVWLGVHYPSDVVAGWLGGAGYALATAALFAGRRAAAHPMAGGGH